LTGATIIGVACSGTGRARPVSQAARASAVTTTSSTIPTTTTAPTTVPTTTTIPVPAFGPGPAGPGAPPPIVAAGWIGLSGDGVWQPAGRAVGTSAAVYTTVVRPGPGASPVGIAWMDTARLRFALYSGAGQPSGTWSTQGVVAAALWPTLVAGFNSGFQLGVSRGGWFLDGRAAVPLRNGAASFVVLNDGRATVAMWGRDAALTPDVVAVRQNLDLLVDGGQPAADVESNIIGNWGATLGGGTRVWRSAVGVDAAGHLLFAGGPALDPATLAGAIIAAGAIRAMELDINPAWVVFISYANGPAGPVGTRLLPSMNFSSDHFLHPYFRDFFAVFART
jgi:hypothetical protein